MNISLNEQVFFSLVKAGLWEKDVQMSQYRDINLCDVYRIAEEQSIIGLVAAGLEHVRDIKIPKEQALAFVGTALRIERRNVSMNDFLARLFEKLRKEGVYALLVKGQGIAQCYERPLWRACGDVDLFLDELNYEKAKDSLLPLADTRDKEFVLYKHLGLTLEGYLVELHGTLRPRLSKRIDRIVDDIQDATFKKGEVRIWNNRETEIFLPSADNDAIFLFTHILKHFFQGGIGLRQVCDWCRFLWTYRGKLDQRLLSQRLSDMGLMTEWKAFGAFAVDYLGMPVEAMPLYSSERKWSNKGRRISRFIMSVGNFGVNRSGSYSRSGTLLNKIVSFWWRTTDGLRHSLIFPLDSIRIFGRILWTGLHLA